MNALHLLAMGAALAALPFLASTDAAAQQGSVGGPRITLPSHGQHLFSWEGGHHRLRGGVFVVEREVPVIVQREVVREVPAAALANSGTLNRDVPKLARKPYAIGATYASLPGGCMKLIDEAVPYYFCGGREWYRQLGAGKDSRYRAVAKP